MDITCIIPCHNQTSTVIRAVESAINQADRVIVIDDASFDNPISRLREHFNEHPRLAWGNTFSHAPAGVCHARNLAITMAKTGLILPLDADDWLVDGAVQKLVDAYKPHHFVYGNWIEINNDKETELSPPPPTMIRQKNIGYATFLFHKDDWHNAGGYRSEFNLGGEHWGFMAGLWYRAKAKPTYVDSPIFYYNRTHNKRYGRANRYHKTIQALVGEVISGQAGR